MNKAEKSKRGFASMNKDKQHAIASKGGVAAHAQGRAHVFTADEARAAGQLGGAKVAADREHMAEIGRRGGAVSGKQRAAKAAASTS